MEKVIAKFECNSVIDNPEYKSKTVSFHAVYGNGLENKSFSKYTPAANLSMVISYDTQAVDFFKQGKQYYLDFTEASNIND